jgi:hypothetical protein
MPVTIKRENTEGETIGAKQVFILKRNWFLLSDTDMMKMDNVEKHPTKQSWVLHWLRWGRVCMAYTYIKTHGSDAVRGTRSQRAAVHQPRQSLIKMYAPRLWMLAKQLKGVNNG